MQCVCQKKERHEAANADVKKVKSEPQQQQQQQSKNKQQHKSSESSKRPVTAEVITQCTFD